MVDGYSSAVVDNEVVKSGSNKSVPDLLALKLLFKKEVSSGWKATR